MEFIRDYFDGLKRAVDSVSVEDAQKVVDVLYDAYKKNRQIFIFGNGGSASAASHFACDLGKGTLQRVYDDNERRFRAMSLTDNVALMTALGNDMTYEDIFSQQLKNLVAPGDVVIAITGSGNSPNIVKALETAARRGAVSDHYGKVEDVHMALSHLICSYLSELKKKE
jgi:D-sedoheptulose 7-phosphate isomerase